MRVVCRLGAPYDFLTLSHDLPTTAAVVPRAGDVLIEG